MQFSFCCVRCQKNATLNQLGLDLCGLSKWKAIKIIRSEIPMLHKVDGGVAKHHFVNVQTFVFLFGFCLKKFKFSGCVLHAISTADKWRTFGMKNSGDKLI